MSDMRECKRCLLLQSGDEENYLLVKKHIEKIKPEDRTDSITYEKRLEACRECENLISGTCMRCGCYVEFRAAFRNKKCPAGKWRGGDN